MRNWLIEALGGVTQAEQQANSKSTDELIGEIKRIADLAQAELNKKNKELRAANLLVRDLQAERDELRNERNHLKRANEALHKEHDENQRRIDELVSANLGLENRVLELNSSNAELRSAAREPKRRYRLDAFVNSHMADTGEKVTSYSLDLIFTPETGTKVLVEVRTLAASKKSKDELDKIALQINSMVERFVNL